MVSKKAKQHWKSIWRGVRSPLPKDHIGHFDMKVGVVREAIHNPRASHKYYITTVNFGDVFSDVVGAALVHHYEPEELIGQTVICCCNIKAAWTSSDFYTNMLVASSSDQFSKLELLIPPYGAVPGDAITVIDYPPNPDRPYIDPKAGIFEEIMENVKINDRGQVLFKSKLWVLERDPSAGYVHVVRSLNSSVRIV